MATSQDPGSLGVYGFRDRIDYSYDRLGMVNSASVQEFAIWDWLAQEGKKSIIVAVPPNYPPRGIAGISVGCFLTPDARNNVFAAPSYIQTEITALVGEYPVDVSGFRTEDKEWLKREIFAMSRKQWEVVRWLMREKEWDYLQFVDIGLDRMHHGFWHCFDKSHPAYEPANPHESAIPEYYRLLDEQLGKVLEMLDEDTIVLIVSDHGAQRLEGGFAVNEWLIREGLLVLEEFPREITPFSKLRVNWARTKVWGEGGYYARIFFNVRGREPEGVIPPDAYPAFQNELKAKFEALADPQGRSLNSLVFKPQEIYRDVRRIPPDLIVQFGALSWRSVGSVGYNRLHVQENDMGPDACNHAQYGMFILAASNCPLRGEYQGAKLLDIAPTLLDLAGYEIPSTMQGRSLVAGTHGGSIHPQGLG